MNVERNKMIVNAVKIGQDRKEIANQFGVTENAISKICRRAGVRARRFIDEELKKEIAEYRNTHNLRETAKKYNVTMMSVSTYHRKYGGDVELEEEPYNQVRVLKEVPNGFVAPRRRW